MIIKASEKKIDIFKNRFGGDGEATIEHLLDEKLIMENVVLYAKVTFKPGNNFGYHKHEGTNETITVISGVADYNDNGTWTKLYAGDTIHCPEGESHCIGNAADATEDLVLHAIIVKTK